MKHFGRIQVDMGLDSDLDSILDRFCGPSWVRKRDEMRGDERRDEMR